MYRWPDVQNEWKSATDGGGAVGDTSRTGIREVLASFIVSPEKFIYRSQRQLTKENVL